MVLIAGIFARETIYDVPLQSFHTLSVRHRSQSSLPLRAPTVTEAVTHSAAKADPRGQCGQCAAEGSPVPGPEPLSLGGGGTELKLCPRLRRSQLDSWTGKLHHGILLLVLLHQRSYW